jgi:hypothetical protein
MEFLFKLETPRAADACDGCTELARETRSCSCGRALLVVGIRDDEAETPRRQGRLRNQADCSITRPSPLRS